MNLVVIPSDSDDKETEEIIFNQLKGKRFIAISYDPDNDKFIMHIKQMTSLEIVFACQSMINKEMSECVFE